MTSELTPTGPYSSLPLADGAPSPPDAKESLFFRPSDTPPASASLRGQYLRERMARKHRHTLSARALGAYANQNSLPKKLDSGEKAFKAKLVSREAACRRLSTTTWELEEVADDTNYIQAVYEDECEIL
ncbi:hypothetical protein C8R48DRAFT_680201 [Suillus tomentosus]|nr:hypothetical protein C8R48DRAFT_680201 [Suillus tomentosus]